MSEPAIKVVHSASRGENADKASSDVVKLKRIRDIALKSLTTFPEASFVISPKQADAIQSEIRDAVRGVCSKYKLDMAGAEVECNTNSIKVSVVASSLSLNGLDCYHQAYLESGMKFGLKPEWLGKTVVNKGCVYTVDGLDLTSDQSMLRLIILQNGQSSRLKMPIDENTANVLQKRIADFDAAMRIPD
tara:strand:- start:1639 stop:2205 length:567 start_codon:yes stop_codon:yes gene_type:complete